MVLKGKVKGRYYCFDPKTCSSYPGDKTLSDVVHLGWIPDEYFLEDWKGKKQGVCQYWSLSFVEDKDSLLPSQEVIKEIDGGGVVYKYLYSITEYKNNMLNGLDIRYRPNGTIERIVPYKNGERDGLGYQVDKNGEIRYSRYKHDVEVAEDGTIRQQWRETVEGLKYEKKQDEFARSATLKKVLEAGTKEDKKKALKELHSKESPVGVKRRTALKFDR